MGEFGEGDVEGVPEGGDVVGADFAAPALMSWLEERGQPMAVAMSVWVMRRWARSARTLLAMTCPIRPWAHGRQVRWAAVGEGVLRVERFVVTKRGFGKNQ
ncbi:MULTISPECIES: hypothetical protein [unclassified Frankia]|uniref:hypothetical protein n=1 Tax=unclassified Frankia TaxID=2632575 RepID=UPI002AD31F9B|nr:MULTISPECIES: hypothetical protein [unclassified Frankia]